MKLPLAVIVAVGALIVAAFPAVGSANGPAYNPGGGPSYHPAPHGPPPHAKAHGFRCKGFSKKHVKGEKGTPFSRCVKAMAKAEKNEKLSPGQACKGLSKKHVKGQKGTEFSRCVKAAAKMRKGVRYESPALTLGPNGWAGWSCPSGKTVIGGGVVPSSATLQFSGPAKPGEAMYPAYPHYTFSAGETGWVVQNDNDQETVTVFVICR